MDAELWDFVTKFRDHTSSYNITSQLAPWVGKFRMDRKDLEAFWQLYCTRLRENPNFLCGFAEKPNDFLPLLVDVDLGVKLEDGVDTEEKLYSLEEAKTVMRAYQRAIKETSREYKNRNSACLLLEKEPYVSGEKLKSGFHLHFPRLWIRNCDHDLHIFPRAVEILNAEHPGLFAKLKVRESGSLLDPKVCNKHWLLYGAAKSETSGSYRFTKAFDAAGDEINLSDAFVGYRLYDALEEEIKCETDEDWERQLPRILSTHPAGKQITYMKSNLECISKAALSTAEERTRVHQGNVNVAETMKVAADLMPMVAAWRADNYEDWHEMGRILFQVGDGCQEALDLWLQFSARTTRENNFDEAYCLYQWKKMVNVQAFTIGSLHYYANNDSPKEYEAWKRRKAASRVKDSLLGGHNDLAKMLKDMYGNVFVCTIVEEKAVWFEYKSHGWARAPKGIALRQKISEDLAARFVEQSKELYANISDEGEDDESGPQKKLNKVRSLIGKLKSATFKNCIMTEAQEVFFQDDFMDRLDSDVNYMRFTNGVLDCRNMSFGPGKPEQFVSLSTGYDYKEFLDDSPEVLEVKDFLIKVFPDPALRRYFLEYSAQLLKGGNFRKIFINFSGVGDNGKSVTIELIEKALGKYAVKLPTTLLTGKRTQSSQAAPELARTRGTRFAVLQEPSKKDVINQGVLKELTGNDSFFARTLFKEGGEIRPQFKLALICNALPRLPEDDPACWNRIRVLPFESCFPKDPSEVPKTWHEQLAAKIFYRDDDFGEKLVNMRQAFMWLLVQTLKEIAVKGPTAEPVKVTEATAVYRRANDIFLKFIHEAIKEDQTCKSPLSLHAAYELFQQWFRMSGFSGITMPSKDDLREDLLRRWGPTDSLNWVGYRRRTARDEIAEGKALVLGATDLAAEGGQDLEADLEVEDPEDADENDASSVEAQPRLMQRK
jgi:P4 family phage/plasmid primase-like protien